MAEIARLWRGVTLERDAHLYRRHALAHVFPAIARIDGHVRAELMERTNQGRTEFLVLTVWRSPAAIKAFAGEDYEVARIEEEARAVLVSFDDRVEHFELKTSLT